MPRCIMGDCSTAVVTAVAPPPSVLNTYTHKDLHTCTPALHIHKERKTSQKHVEPAWVDSDTLLMYKSHMEPSRWDVKSFITQGRLRLIAVSIFCSEEKSLCHAVPQPIQQIELSDIKLNEKKRAFSSKYVSSKTNEHFRTALWHALQKKKKKN